MAIFAAHGLGRTVAHWLAFWCKRNFPLVVMSLLRGFAFIRPGSNPAQWAGSIANFVFFPICLASLDLVLLLKPRAVFTAMYAFFLLLQSFSLATNYIEGRALDAPCSPPLHATSAGLFLLRKAQNAVLLFFSLFLLGLLVKIKAIEGIKVPILRLSDEGRFFAEDEGESRL
jgi:hypothetical protein